MTTTVESDSSIEGSEVSAGYSKNPIVVVLKNEFKCKNFGLQYESEHVYVNSQWPFSRWFFLIYRVLVAIYTLVILFINIFTYNFGLVWIAWLTNWSYIVLTCYMVCSAVVVVLDVVLNWRYSDAAQSPAHRALRICIKVNMVLFAIAVPAAFTVTIIYFIAIYSPQSSVGGSDINVHIMNSVLAFLELIVTALPVRLLHIIYIYLYGTVYVVFSVIYWAADNTNVMYPDVLDWNKPEQTVIVLVILYFAGLPILQIFMFIVYRLRLAIYHCLFERS